MSRLYSERPVLRRPFVVTAYVLNAAGDLIAEIPTRCPLGAGEDHPGCRIGIHHRRKRKTGPGVVWVAQCRTHAVGFSLYPPGYAPYRRQPVVRAAPDGQSIRFEDEESELRGTLLEAAQDAGQGRAWARDSDPRPPESWWSTQGRHLDLASRIVGIASDLSECLRSSLASVLGVSTLVLREGSRAQGYRQIGAAICTVLSHVRRGARHAWRWLWCGYLIGHWGKPMHWDGKRNVLECPPFPDARTPG